MKTASLTVASALFAAASLASASKYNAVCVFDELKCGGSIMLREYTPDTAKSCENKDCAAIMAPGVTSFSAMPTCTDDHVTDTEKHLKGKPYVIVETYAGTGCAGDFASAVAVVASGKCFPSSKGDMSYMVTLGASDLSVMWKQYTDGNCSSTATEVSFMASETDRKMCVKDTMKVLAVKPGGASATTMPPTAMNGSAATPAPTTSGVSTISSVAFAASAVAMAAVALFA